MAITIATDFNFEALAGQFGTPFYLYDADVVDARVQQVRTAFGGLVEVYYAVKANPNLELLKSIRSTVDGLDISSAGELDQAILAGYSGSSISFAGPAKSVEELSAAVGQGVGCISVESQRELSDCVELGRKHGQPVGITLRVNPRTLNRNFGLKMGGRATQFGIDEEDLLRAAQFVEANLQYLDFRGIHVYAGSQCFDAGGIVEEVRNTMRLAALIERPQGPLFCSVVNLGGGFGASHADGSKEMSLEELGPLLTPSLQEFRESSGRRRRLIFELGRFLVSGAGIYVTRVISSKATRGKTFFVVDGGLHHHLAAAGTFGAALRAQYELRNLSHPAEEAVVCNVAGPSCNPTDLLGVDASIPAPRLGDLIGVMNSGSYGLTASPILFLGRRTPAEIVAHGGRCILGRRPHGMTEFN